MLKPIPQPTSTVTRRAVRVVVVAVAILAMAISAAAVDVNGSVSLFSTNTDNRGAQSSLFEQRYSLDLYQTITPYIDLRLGYRYLDFKTSYDLGPDFYRRNQLPRLTLGYHREQLQASVTVEKRSFESSLEQSNFEAKSIAANVSWNSNRGPGFQLSFRDESNVADTAVFGTSSDTQLLAAEVFYKHPWWRVSYAFGRNTLSSGTSGIQSIQNRHELRLNASKTVLNKRLSLGFSASAGRLDRVTETAPGSTIAEPIPPRQGLFLVDTTPEIGSLDATPGLVDGDFATPSPPGINIGGANIYRNIGIEFGVSSPVTRLEITVDQISGPSVEWAVFHSSDNLVWTPIQGVTTEWDPAFLRYTLIFPETTDRFFKAVNLSVNVEPVVMVTEMRALIDVKADAGRSEFNSTLIRADAYSIFRVSRRVIASVDVGLTNDEDISAGFVRREFHAMRAGARVSAGLSSTLTFNAGYTFVDSENRRDPVLLRTEQMLNASLSWVPLPAVNAVASVQQREEFEEALQLQSTRSARILASTDLLPDLRLISDLQFSMTEDFVGEFKRRDTSWGETLEARMTSRWYVGAGFRMTQYDTQGDIPLRDRKDLNLRTTWSPTPYVTVYGNWSYYLEQDTDNLRQSYGLSYTPGPKLRLAANFQELETVDRRSTSTSSVSIDYRLNRHISFHGNLSESRATEDSGQTAAVTSLRTGLRAIF